MAKKTTVVSDDTLVAAARGALEEFAKPDHIGDALTPTRDGEVYTVTFPSQLPGYPGWNWVVSLSDGEGGQLGVMEMHLLPGEGALLAPDWVPWSDRLDEYRRQEAQREADELDTDDDDDDLVDDIDDVLDGVDIDQLDLDPQDLEVPEEPNDVFDHVDLDDED